MNKLNQYAFHYLKIELMKARLHFYCNESGAVGSDLIVKSKTGQYYEMALYTLNIEGTERSVKIPKSVWDHQLPQNTWVAFVLLMKDSAPTIYLIPCSAFENPDGRILIDNDQGERFAHLSNWEIKVFTDGIEQLSAWHFDNQVGNLK